MKKTYNLHYALTFSVALLTFLVYLPTLRNEFVYWDDNRYIFENPYIRSLDARFFRWAFLGFHVSNWHPLTWISHALDYALWGLNPLGHHLTSIILHAVNTALVVVLALKLFETVRDRTQQNAANSFLNDRTTLIAAGVTGLLFGIHPVHVESVAWVSERKDLLCALFFLLSVLLYAKAARRMGHGAERMRLTSSAMLSALCFFVLALMSKPMAVSLPAVLLILDWYPFNRIRSWKTFWAAAVEKLPFIALGLVSSIVTILAQNAGKAFQTIDFVPLPARTLVGAKALVAYLGKMVLPFKLIPFYPYPREVSLFSLEYLSALVLVIGITAAAVIAAKRQRAWLAAWGYYVVTLIPVLGIIQVGGQAMADRYTYLPSLGPFILAGLCTAWVVEKVSTVGETASIMGKVSIAIALILFFVSLSFFAVRQITVWHDSFSLWTYVIENGAEKSPMAYVNRGAAFQKNGLFDKALADYETAIDLDPSDYRARISLGAALEHLGQFDRAKETFDKAIDLNSSSPEAFQNRGILLEKMGRHDEAIADYTRAVALQSDYYEAYNNRGLIYAKTNQLEKAIADYNEAISINPRHFNAYLNRGIAFTLVGQYEKALEDLNTAVLLGDDNAVAYYDRGMFYRRTGNNDLARSDVRKACDLGNERACSALQQLKQGVHP